MFAAALLPYSLGLVVRAPRAPSPRMGARLDGMVLGEAVAPEVLQKLGVEGTRAAIMFFCRDDGFECTQQLRDLQERAGRYIDEYKCEVVAIRSRGSWIKEDTPSKYPLLRFHVDEGDELKQAFRMDIGQVNDRQSFLLDAQGRVQGSLNIYNDPYAHSQMAIRTLRAMDDANNPWDAAASDPAGVEEKAAKMKAAYEEEMAAKLAKQAALEAKAATGDARFSDSPATGQDLRYTESSGDGPSFGKFFESFMPGKKK